MKTLNIYCWRKFICLILCYHTSYAHFKIKNINTYCYISSTKLFKIYKTTPQKQRMKRTGRHKIFNSLHFMVIFSATNIMHYVWLNRKMQWKHHKLLSLDIYFKDRWKIAFQLLYIFYNITYGKMTHSIKSIKNKASIYVVKMKCLLKMPQRLKICINRNNNYV